MACWVPAEWVALRHAGDLHKQEQSVIGVTDGWSSMQYQQALINSTPQNWQT